MAKNLRTGLRQSIKASGKAGVTGGGIFSLAPLDLRFALLKTLDSRVTFTRASTGTFVGSDGLLRSAVTNLLTYSEQFDNAAWTKGVGVSVAPNTTISPVGTLTADTVTADSGISILQNINSVVGTSYTNSAYVKAGTATSVMFRDDTGAGRHIVFNPSTGVITATSGTFVSTPVSQPLGDGWYRYLMTYVADTTSVRGLIRPNSAGSAQTFIAWGAQIEAASTVGEYIPTTSVINSAPRFDHNPTTGESLGLLVEEARTNLSLYSEDLSNASWTKTDCTITANESTAPDGTTTADLWTNTASPGIISNSITKDTTARTYTSSLWVKGTLTQFTVSLDDGTTVNRGRVQFNLSNNTVGSIFNDGTFTSTSGTLTQFLNGWVRVTVTTTTSSGITIRLRPFFSGATSTLRVWGAQVEEGAFATSYIPTTTATATRAADVASITGANFSSWYNQTEGTVFADWVKIGASNFQASAALSDGTSANLIALTHGSGAPTTNARFDVNAGGVSQASLVLVTGSVVGTPYKNTGAYKVNDFAAASNGGSPLTDTVGIIPTTLQLTIGANSGAGFLNGTIKRLVYWGQRLPNNVLQAITQ